MCSRFSSAPAASSGRAARTSARQRIRAENSIIAALTAAPPPNVNAAITVGLPGGEVCGIAGSGYFTRASHRRSWGERDAPAIQNECSRPPLSLRDGLRRAANRRGGTAQRDYLSRVRAESAGDHARSDLRFPALSGPPGLPAPPAPRLG